jgi:N-acetyl-1-D-myo-inositol-2-amino-2-deoxy-alpha-D-glucopyranoside deacetylase
VLAVFAHPDDETLLAGGLLAAWAAEGRQIHLLCLAPGDDEDLLHRMQLAAAELGVVSVSSLRFRPWSREQAHREGMPRLMDAPLDVIAERIAGRVSELSPGIVLTHSAYGDYGHPDHVIAHRAAVAAAGKAAGTAAVLALAWPRRIARMFVKRSMKNLGVALDARVLLNELQKAPPATETVDVRPFLRARKSAARHYQEEIRQGPLPMRMLEAAPVRVQSLFLGKTRLSRVEQTSLRRPQEGRDPDPPSKD